MSFIALVNPIYFNVLQYGATGNGSTDDTSAIQSAINAASGGGVVFFPPGTYKITTPLSMSHQGTRLLGTGLLSIIQPSSGFSGANMITITANFCGVAGFSIQYANPTYSSNPTADAIQITGSSATFINDVYFQAINGWCIQSTATATANYNTRITECRGYQCKQFIHLLGVAASSFAGTNTITNCYGNQIENGDCYFLEDIQDVLMTNIFGETAAGSGNSIHIKGAVASCYIENFDLGPYPGPATGAIVLMEQSANGVPNQIGLCNGVIEGGSTGVTISNATNTSVRCSKIFNCGSQGINITGGDSIVIEGCHFSGNGVTGSSGKYEMQIAGNHTEVFNCYFNSPQGTGAAHVNNALNCISGTTSVINCYFFGTGITSGNAFNNYPPLIRSCPGYSPAGLQTAPTIGASPFTTTGFAQDCQVFIHGGTWTVLSLNGSATGFTSALSSECTIRVPAGSTLTLTYTVAPTWVWIAE